MTREEADQCSRDCLQRRLRNYPLLRMDPSKAGMYGAEKVQKAFDLAASDPVKFDGLLTHPTINALFNSGALHFRRDA